MINNFRQSFSTCRYYIGVLNKGPREKRTHDYSINVVVSSVNSNKSSLNSLNRDKCCRTGKFKYLSIVNKQRLLSILIFICWLLREVTTRGTSDFLKGWQI